MCDSWITISNERRWTFWDVGPQTNKWHRQFFNTVEMKSSKEHRKIVYEYKQTTKCWREWEVASNDVNKQSKTRDKTSFPSERRKIEKIR